MGIIKDFTQNAYDDIKGYIGGTEDWEEIESLYGVVDCDGIYHNDYLGELQSYGSAYNDENELAIRNLDFLFDGVNSVDDNYAVLFRDEQMDMSSFSTAITELAGLLNKNSVENIYTMDVNALGNKIDTIQSDAQNQLIEYYKSTFIQIHENGMIDFNWDRITYEIRKPLSDEEDAELAALASIFPYLYSEDPEKNKENIENMLRAAYGKVDIEEWKLTNQDAYIFADYLTDTQKKNLEWSQKYYNVSLTDTFVAAATIYYERINTIDYQSIMELESESETYIYYQNQFSMSSLLKTFINDYSTIKVFFNKNFVVNYSNENEKVVSVHTNIKDLPVDISYLSVRNISEKIYNYNVLVSDEEQKNSSLFQIYGLLNYTNVGHAVTKSDNICEIKWLNDDKEETHSVGEITFNEVETFVEKEAVQRAMNIVAKDISKAIPLFDVATSIYNDIENNNKAIQHNNRIDKRITQITENANLKDVIIDFTTKGYTYMQLVCKDGTFYIERYVIDVKRLQNDDNYINFKNKDGIPRLTPHDLEGYLNGKGEKNSEIDNYFRRYR